MFESKSGVFLVAGVGFFALAFLGNAVVPWVMYRDQKEKTVEEMVNRNILRSFEALSDQYPESFARHYGEPPPRPKAEDFTKPAPEAESLTMAQERAAKLASREEFFREKCAEALRLGRKIYVGEGCWHCHSQFVRPVSNEDKRWGPVAKSWEYNNELQRPVLFGTRRVGPDLSREGGRRGNDWHAVHFFKPRLTSPESVMPEYPWFFEESSKGEALDGRGRLQKVSGPVSPNKRGLALITYMQWLGSWLDCYPHYEAQEALPLKEDGK